MTEKALIIKYALRTVINAFLGVVLYAVGIVMTINANLGMAPWDMLHQGLANIFNITFGVASIYVGILLLVINTFLGEKVGWGTVFNIICIGFFVDFIRHYNLIPIFDNILLRLISMLFGLFVIGVGSRFYLSVGLGAGPRDGLMVGLTKKTKKSVRLIRNSIEMAVATIGYLLGGPLGIGTVIMATTTGFFIQFAFSLFRFDVKKIRHRSIDMDIKFLYKLINEKLSEKENKEIDDKE